MSENIKQYDSYGWVHVLKFDDGDPIDLTNAKTVIAVATLDGDDERTIEKECSVLNAENGYINLALTADDTAVAGMYRMSFKCTFIGNTVLTVPSTGNLWLHIEESL